MGGACGKGGKDPPPVREDAPTHQPTKASPTNEENEAQLRETAPDKPPATSNPAFAVQPNTTPEGGEKVKSTAPAENSVPAARPRPPMVHPRALAGRAPAVEQDLMLQSAVHLLNKNVTVRRDENGRKWINKYECLETLGKGSYGKVKLCMSDEDKRLYAVKCVSRRVRVKGKRDTLRNVLKEIAILKKLQHKNIVQFYEALSDEAAGMMYIVLEYVSKGASRSGSTRSEPLQLDTAWRYFRDAINAVEFMHERHIIHRDIKPENMLIDEDGTLKLSDFGVSEQVTADSDIIANTAGTPAFLAPECCKVGAFHGKPSDAWALGVTLYYFVAGRIPFLASSLPEIYQHIREQPVMFDVPLPQDLCSLIRGLLTKDPKLRTTLPQCRVHPWVTKDGTVPLERPPLISPESATPAQDPEEIFARVAVRRKTRMDTAKAEIRKAAGLLDEAVSLAEAGREGNTLAEMAAAAQAAAGGQGTVDAEGVRRQKRIESIKAAQEAKAIAPTRRPFDRQTSMQRHTDALYFHNNPTAEGADDDGSSPREVASSSGPPLRKYPKEI
mmetsp:Transcript_32357/g.69910  ORF Transcript_32357/g.69910 Transcript_32357/m.69910 type:complete len:556 (-) Transcript_32357:72-1739(-)